MASHIPAKINPYVDKLLRESDQNLFEFDPISRCWYAKENTSYFAPTEQIEDFFRIMMKEALVMAKECSLDNSEQIDYTMLRNLMKQRYGVV